MNFKPMLAEDVKLGDLLYPIIISPKLDGVRATFVNGQLLTRSLKPIANKRVNEVFKTEAMLDGELIVGSPTDPAVFRNTMKVVSAHEADIKDLRYYVFDWVGVGRFSERLKDAHRIAKMSQDIFVPVPHSFVYNESQLLHAEEHCLNQGYEGLMIRDPDGPYKFGRSTQRERYLLKLKRKMTSEGEVVEVVEQMHNANEAKLDALGYTERSSHKANMIPTGVMGALVLRDLKTGVVFNVGTGFTFAERQEIWKDRPKYIGKIVTYEYLPVGVKDKPRHPVFKGWRIKEDL